jgi:uncharacterized membrane-anchored protein
MIKNIILIVSMFILFALFNVGIYQKEQILENGDTILLKLQPLDPRSMVAGDYMAFRYAIADEISNPNLFTGKSHGFLVIKPNEDNVGEFVRIFQGEVLATNEKLVKYTYSLSNHHFIIKPDSFHFQEGLQPLYQKAQYAIFHFNGFKNYLIVGLADSNRNEIRVVDSANTDKMSGTQ